MIDIGSFQISAQHPALEGHFPGNPIVPGVVLLEYFERALETAFPELSIAKMTNIKFLQTVLPDIPVIVSINTDKLESHHKISFQLRHAASDLKLVSGIGSVIEKKHD